MRQIVFLDLSSISGIDIKKCLDILVSFTPLVEPMDGSQIYLDLTGCRDSIKKLTDLGQQIHNSFSGQLRIGLATGKIFACIAAGIDFSFLKHHTTLLRFINTSSYRLVKVLPGREAAFLAPLPLEKIPGLNPSKVKRLSRMGITTMQDIDGLSSQKLIKLLGNGADQLYHLRHGIDLSPVIGCYPPHQIIYPVFSDIPIDNHLQLEKALQEASQKLVQILDQRYLGCQEIILEVESGRQWSNLRRETSSLCYHSNHLYNLLCRLLQSFPLIEPVDSLRIILGKISPRQVEQPSLFSSQVQFTARQRERRVTEILTGLCSRFPGTLQQGISSDRREQVLALWDPWRR